MSPRNFARVFNKEMKTTPAKFVERLRVEAARRRGLTRIYRPARRTRDRERTGVCSPKQLLGEVGVLFASQNAPLTPL